MPSCGLCFNDTGICYLFYEDVRTLQSSLDKMLDWSYKWALKLNISKCKVLHASRQSSPCELKYYMNGDSEMESVSCEKDVVVHIDSKLSFETHVIKSVCKDNRNLGIIHRSFKQMGEEVFVNLYKSLVRPHVEYASVVWNPSCIRDQKLIERVQRRATKLVTNISELSYEERLRKLGIPTLQ